MQTLLWTDGDSHIPTDYRIYGSDEKTKNEHFADLLIEAKKRGFEPACVCFDSWYGSLDNLKKVTSLGWNFLTQLKSNRLVNPDRSVNRAICEINISEGGRIVHLKGYGMIKVFKMVSQNGNIDYFATNMLEIKELELILFKEKYWAIESYHKAIKQYCGIEKCQARLAIAQQNHIGLAIRAFLRIERFSLKLGKVGLKLKLKLLEKPLKII